MKKYRKQLELIGEWFPSGEKDVFEVRFTGRLVGKWFTDNEPNFNSQNQWREWRVYELPSKSLVMFKEDSEPSSFYDILVTFSTYDSVEDLQDEEVPAGLVDQVRKATGREYPEPVFGS